MRGFDNLREKLIKNRIFPTNMGLTNAWESATVIIHLNTRVVHQTIIVSTKGGKNMTIDDVRDTILAICKDCDIEDLDVDMSDLFPGQPYRIGTFFLIDDCLYHGELAGSPTYWPIGRCRDIRRILYRLYDTDRTVDFLFDFGDMLFALTHHEYRSCALELIKNGSSITDEAEILSILRERIMHAAC